MINVMKSLTNDFPEIFTIEEIGKSYQGRPISMLVMDARSYLIKQRALELSQKTSEKPNPEQPIDQQLQQQIDNELHNHFHQKPAIVLTGSHHSREHITVQTVLYTALKMLHGALFQDSQKDIHLLLQNKFYLIPSINVDGSAFIDEMYYKTGLLEKKRKNMRPLMTEEERNAQKDKLMND